MFQALGQIVGSFGDYFAMQNASNKESLDSQRQATLSNYEEWKVRNAQAQEAYEKAEEAYNTKRLQQNLSIGILLIFILFLAYLSLKKKKK